MKIRTTTLRRTVAAVSVAGLLGLGLAACSGDSKDDETATPSATVAEKTTEPTTDVEDTDLEDTEDTDVADGDIAAFCAAAEALGDADASSVDSTDMAAMQAWLNGLNDTVQAAVPPAEVAAEWATVADLYNNLNDVVNAMIEDPTNPDALTKYTETMQSISEDGFMESLFTVSMYAAEHCS